MSNIPAIRKWRQRMGISLDSISASTKLSIRQLEAIESGEFRKLPGGIYNTSYIKQYAQAIGFDEAQLLAWYHDSCKTDASDSASRTSSSGVSGPLFQS